MSLRRLASVSIILFFNVVLVLLYIPSRLRTPVIDAEFVVDRTVMASAENKTMNATKNETISKTIPYVPSVSFPLDFNFTLNPTDLCSTKNLKSKMTLLILVCTAVPNFLQRQTIRDTWGSVVVNNTGYARLAFLVGSTINTTVQKELENEAIQHSDIIQQNFVDSYQNLTLKSIMLLKWVTGFCPDVQYVLKTDDDMYVNVGNLIKSISRFPVKSNVMYGVLFKKAKPNRNPAAKWFVPKNQFDGDMFPDYLSGTGYVMSRDIVPELLEASATLPFLVMEDVFITGLCASQCRVKRYNIRGFAHWRRLATGCAFKDVITGHHVSVKDMIKIWRELQKRPLVCKQLKKKA